MVLLPFKDRDFSDVKTAGSNGDSRISVVPHLTVVL
jgi:hypothetical protein